MNRRNVALWQGVSLLVVVGTLSGLAFSAADARAQANAALSELKKNPDALLSKTAQTERQLNELQTRTTHLETRVFRAQALVEQTVARRARAEEALRKLDEKGAKP